MRNYVFVSILCGFLIGLNVSQDNRSSSSGVGRQFPLEGVSLGYGVQRPRFQQRQFVVPQRSQREAYVQGFYGGSGRDRRQNGHSPSVVRVVVLSDPQEGFQPSSQGEITEEEVRRLIGNNFGTIVSSQPQPEGYAQEFVVKNVDRDGSRVFFQAPAQPVRIQRPVERQPVYEPAGRPVQFIYQAPSQGPQNAGQNVIRVHQLSGAPSVVQVQELKNYERPYLVPSQVFQQTSNAVPNPVQSPSVGASAPCHQNSSGGCSRPLSADTRQVQTQSSDDANSGIIKLIAPSDESQENQLHIMKKPCEICCKEGEPEPCLSCCGTTPLLNVKTLKTAVG